MINLLPNEHKDEIRAARTNVLLLRYITMLVSAVIVLSGLVIGSYVVLNSTRDSAQLKVDENQKDVSQYQSIKVRADSFRSDLATAKTILDESVSYTKLTYRIAETLPANVVIDTLALDPKTFGTKMTLNANARTFNDASKLKDAFSRDQELFSSVQLISIESGDSGSGDDYPVKVSISLIINKGGIK